MMSVYSEGRAFARDTRVSLFNADMMSGLISVVGCGSIPWLAEVGGRW
jgi:hypothetical protein